MTRMYNTVPKVKKKGESWGNTGLKNKTENHLSKSKLCISVSNVKRHS